MQRLSCHILWSALLNLAQAIQCGDFSWWPMDNRRQSTREHAFPDVVNMRDVMNKIDLKYRDLDLFRLDVKLFWLIEGLTVRRSAKALAGVILR